MSCRVSGLQVGGSTYQGLSFFFFLVICSILLLTTNVVVDHTKDSADNVVQSI